jgi:hypothetical protein
VIVSTQSDCGVRCNTARMPQKHRNTEFFLGTAPDAYAIVAVPKEIAVFLCFCGYLEVRRSSWSVMGARY